MPTRTYDLVGSKEAAELLGVGPTNFSHLARKLTDAGDDSFPQPVLRLGCGPIWEKSAMTKFKKHYDSTRRRVRTNGDTPAPAPEPAKVPAKTSAAKPRKATAKAPAKKVAAKKTTAKKASNLKLVGAAS